MNIKGVDVSSYQGNIDWKSVVKDGIEFSILKIIRKDLNPDNQFENNWNGCLEAGIPVQGVYNYSYANTVEKAITDAKTVLNVLNGRKPMVWMDVEDTVMQGLGKHLIDIINAYGKVITDAGLFFGVYTGLSFYNVHIKPYKEQLNDYPFWIARYPSSGYMSVTDNPPSDKKPEIEHELYGWQYTSSGRVNGIADNVDFDELYVAVESSNVMPQPEKTLHKVGEEIKVSSYYASSTDPIEKAVIRNNSGTIMRIIESARNPYCFGKNGVAIGWCNDGDIRESTETPKENKGKTYKVKSGDVLGKIAKQYNTTVDKIVSDNKAKYPRITANFIVVGWELTV